MTEIQIENNNSESENKKKLSIIHFAKSNKYPLLITLGFFLTFYYITFFHHNYWFEDDGVIYLNWGKDVLNGNGENVFAVNAPLGGAVLFAYLNLFFNDAFLIEKLISLLSATIIVFTTYYIIKNIFNSKIALVGQLILVFSGTLAFQTPQAMNDLHASAFVYLAFYFITKKDLRTSDIIMSAILVGISGMLRYQAGFIFFGIIIFLLVHNKKIRKNLFLSVIFVLLFMITVSPLLIYNYSTYGVLINSNPDFEIKIHSKYMETNLNENLDQSLIKNEHVNVIFYDLNLFFKNFFYNVFYHNSDVLFGFKTIDNSSIMPIIPFVGIIPVLGGFIYCIKPNINKTNLIVLLTSILVMVSLVLFFGDINVHFFAIIITPLFILGIVNFKKIEKRLLPILISSIIYFISISIIPISRIDLFSMYIIIPILGSIFFVNVIPEICNRDKIIKNTSKHRIRKIVVLLIIIVLLVNAVYSYRVVQALLYDAPYIGMKDEFLKIFQKNDVKYRENGRDAFEIGTFLSKQPGIEDSYVMTSDVNIGYYAHSKYIYTTYTEGSQNDTLSKFITRENWSPFELLLSSLNSFPSDRYNISKPLPDYFIYEKSSHSDVDRWYILDNSTNPKILPDFKLIYRSNYTGNAVYKIEK